MMLAQPVTFTIIIPTLGRPSLAVLLDSLAASLAAGPSPAGIVLVDDSGADELLPPPPPDLARLVTMTRTPGRCGPAAARNAGRRSAGVAAGEWLAFLDDDVVVPPTWLAGCAPPPPIRR